MLGGGVNFFGVGDVKQNIYGFRGTKSSAFLNRLSSASVDPAEAAGGLRVDLTANWRSAKGILDFVNRIFARIMTSAFAKIDYDESAKLRPAIEEQMRSDGGPVVELHILDEQSKDAKSKNLYSSRKYEAAMIAGRIKEIVGAGDSGCGFKIFDKQLGKDRPVEYRDIVILMRSPSPGAGEYVEILRLAGIPDSCQSSHGYFEAT